MTSADVRATFSERFGGSPDVIASAAGRVNLIGEHTDYNGGEVLPIAIGRRTAVALRGSGGSRWRLASATQADDGEFDAGAPRRSGGWWDYMAGVVDVLRVDGRTMPACDAAVWSDVPAGAGLSSSAALEVATAAALNALTGGGRSLRDLALEGFRAETEFVGVAVGIMDQFASALGQRGHALHVWCDTGDTEQVPMRESVMIFDTAVPRALRGSAFNTRRAECAEALRLLQQRYPELTSLAGATPEQIHEARLPDPLDRRALHVSEETRRVQAVVAALKNGQPLPGDLLLASHESLRAYYECSRPELDWFVEHVMTHPGIRGARLTGAGWGGCAIAVGPADALRAAAEPVRRAYMERFGLEPRVWHTQAEDGARVDTEGA